MDSISFQRDTAAMSKALASAVGVAVFACVTAAFQWLLGLAPALALALTMLLAVIGLGSLVVALFAYRFIHEASPLIEISAEGLTTNLLPVRSIP